MPVRSIQRCVWLFPVLLMVAGCHGGRESYLEEIENHYLRLITEGTDRYGQAASPVWMSSIDPGSGKYPVHDQRPAGILPRVYLNRSVDAPKGATLYWDFPDVAAANELSEITGCEQYRIAAREYIDYILSKCTAGNGVILWGNHYYYDAFTDSCVRFESTETPSAVDFSTEKGELHEMRPYSPPWALLWEMDSAAILRHIRTVTNNHIADAATGEFNRHADGKRGYAFLEYGGILAYSLAWLYTRTHQPEYLIRADRIISYSFGFRNRQTGLVENCPTQDRWDKHTSTTEIGLWGNYVLKACDLVPDTLNHRWTGMVNAAVSSWLKYGFDGRYGLFYGGLEVGSGKPATPDPEYPYQPGFHSSVWNPLFPTHDYPLQMAECCLRLYQATGNETFKHAADRWVEHISKQTDTRGSDQILYAENYARIIHFLLHYREVVGPGEVDTLLDQVVEEVLSELYLADHHMFRSHTGEIRYDAVDGLGLLSLALLWHGTGSRPDGCLYFF
jgi:hypothetical protein